MVQIPVAVAVAKFTVCGSAISNRPTCEPSPSPLIWTVANGGVPGVTVCVPSNDPLNGVLATTLVPPDTTAAALVGAVGPLQPVRRTTQNTPDTISKPFMSDLPSSDRKQPVALPVRRKLERKRLTKLKPTGLRDVPGT